MKHPIYKISFIFSLIVLLLACKKDLSYETGKGFGGAATGSILDSSGNCQGIIVNGNYIVDTVLTDSNYLLVKVVTTSAGKCKISTDTVNGMWFTDSVFQLTSGAQTIKVKGYGKPILPLASTFTVDFDSTFCQFTIYPAGQPPLATNGDYFPTTVNSNWTYQDNSISDTVRTTVTNYYATDPITGYTYSIFFTTSPSYTQNYYYRKDGNGNYFEYGQLVDSSTAIDYTFLKDNVPVGSFWESPEVTTTMTGVSKAKVHFTIAALNTTYTLNGVAIPNVIKVQEDYMYFVNGAYQTTITDFSYYGKGVGWLATDYPSHSSYNYDILRYTVY
jgi:hypothetical protein